MDIWNKYNEIAKDRGVLISVYNNACGFLWSMSMADGGTDLGYSEYSGNCKESGSFLTIEDAWKDAIKVAKSTTLEEFEKVKSHWSGFANFAKNKLKENQ